ncbi:MAG: branched-chain amino acid ABC transporter permease [Acidimicrobiales bacterium]
MSVRSGARSNRALIIDYRDDVRLFRTGWAWFGLAAMVTTWLLAPIVLSEFQLNVLAYAGVTAIAGIGLNLLTGYTGQVSLGHAVFFGVGGYTVCAIGADHDLPIVVWLPAAALIGALLGAVIGPFALRLRGNYLAIVTLGLVFIGAHVFKTFDSLTGGGAGRSATGAIPVLDKNFFNLAGERFSRNQGYFWLIWSVVGVGALLAKNIVRSRPGRAMRAVRDRDLAAEIVGVGVARYKVGAFAVSSGYAAVAGALYAVLQRFIAPTNFGLDLSIQYIAVIVIGGVGTIFGAVLGALALGSMPRIIEQLSRTNDLPFVSGDKGGPDGFIEVASLNRIIYGVLIVIFLVVEPHGLAAVWLRVKARLQSWPFSY